MRVDMRKFFLQENDNRTNFIKKKLQERGELVANFEENLKDISSRDIVVVTPAYKWTENIVKQIPQDTTVFGGNFNKDLQDYFDKLNYYNFMNNEDFVLQNANYTAEAFLVDLISNTKNSLFDQKILVLGSGRVAKAIWIVLHKLGVPFDISARNEKELNYAKLISKNVFSTTKLKRHTKKYDTIVNTIPFEIFEKFSEQNFKNNVNIFELASKKCLNIAKFSQINYIFCPSLPSKYLGNSAGKLMLQFITKTLK